MIAGIDTGDRVHTVRTSLVRAIAPNDAHLLGSHEPADPCVDYWPLGPSVAVLHHASAGIPHPRDARSVHVNAPDRVVFVLLEGDIGSCEVAGRTWELRSGALYANAPNTIYSYGTGDGIARIVQVERSILDLPVDVVQAAAGRLVTSPLYGLVRSHLWALCIDPGSVSATDQATTVGAATAALTRALLVTSVEPQTHAGRDFVHQYMLDRVKLFIRSSLDDPDLSPRSIATAHNVSLRHIYGLWRREPLPLVATIIRMRLEAAQQRLLLHPDEPVTVVAHRCGFIDAAHFSRRFRQTFGISPTEWRRLRTRSAQA